MKALSHLIFGVLLAIALTNPVLAQATPPAAGNAAAEKPQHRSAQTEEQPPHLDGDSTNKKNEADVCPPYGAGFEARQRRFGQSRFNDGPGGNRHGGGRGR